MLAEIPPNNSEIDTLLDDNALKFVTGPVSAEFLAQLNATSYLLTTNWLEMDASSEKKLALKEYDNGDIEMLLIHKFTHDGKRTVLPKEKLSADRYDELLEASLRQVIKTRYEFDYVQNGITFAMKYDGFTGSELRVLEVDAEDEAKRQLFDSFEFPYELVNVTGKLQYYGYRVAEVI